MSEKFEERKREILFIAANLFAVKGYEKTTVENILQSAGIAKGTFYYYFTSKENVLDTLVELISDDIVERALEIVNNDKLTASEKLLSIILASGNNEASKQVKDVVHQVNNEKMHLKSLVMTVNKLAPVLTKVVVEGNEEGTFKAKYPRETIEILLTAGTFIFDDDIFTWSDEELANKFRGYIHMIETSLGVSEGSMSELFEIITYRNKNIEDVN